MGTTNDLVIELICVTLMAKKDDLVDKVDTPAGPNELEWV